MCESAYSCGKNRFRYFILEFETHQILWYGLYLLGLDILY